MTKNDILDFFKEQDLAITYPTLCKKYDDERNRVHPKKEEVIKILEKWDCRLKYSHSDRMFYEEIKWNNSRLQFSLVTKDGMISNLYMAWNQEPRERIIRSELIEIAEELNPSSIEKLEYPYPFSTSNEDLEEILDFYLTLYKKFKERFLIQDS